MHLLVGTGECDGRIGGEAKRLLNINRQESSLANLIAGRGVKHGTRRQRSNCGPKRRGGQRRRIPLSRFINGSMNHARKRGRGTLRIEGREGGGAADARGGRERTSPEIESEATSRSPFLTNSIAVP